MIIMIIVILMILMMQQIPPRYLLKTSSLEYLRRTPAGPRLSRTYATVTMSGCKFECL